ncbi:MAG TPA: hypothetical protein VH877_27885 [Polyangia bacterium]|nr:hypothetical protein [Polyangia bacterium]
MKWILIDDVMISCATAGAVPDGVWAAYVKDLSEKRFTKHLATAVGAVELTSVQRKSASEAIKRREVPVAVVTDDRLVRGIVTAVSWLGVDIKAFSWGEVRPALRHLRVPPGAEDQAFMGLMNLRNACMSEAASIELRPIGPG